MLYGHGISKLERLFGEAEISFRDPFGIGPVASLALVTFAEVICSVLVALGLFTRYALIPLIIAMAVALFIAHGSDPFSRQEKALLYLLTFISLYIAGPGWYSLDARLRPKA